MTAGVLVTRNAEQFIGPVLDSVFEQTTPLDLLVIVDDASTDATIAAIQYAVERARSGAHPVPTVRIVPAASTSSDAFTRIAGNFLQGVRACAGHEIVILGDHDDRWRSDRVERQVALLEADEHAAMLASNGSLVDIAGAPLPGTLQEAFAVPSDFAARPIAKRIDYVLGRSIATGGASAIRPVLFGELLEVPPGWLHDRWWSIAATAVNAMAVDQGIVIEYRVHDAQQVGLARGTQGKSALRRLTTKISPATLLRLRDVHRLGRRVTSGEARAALSWAAIIRSALS